MTNAAKARLLLVLASAGWGVCFPMMKAVMAAQTGATGASDTWITAQLQLLRYCCAAIVLAAMAWLATRRLPSRSEWTLGAICGAAGAIGMQLQIDALNRTAASTVGFITQFYVLLIPLVAALRTRRAPGWLTIASVMLALAGVAVLSGMTPGDLRPGLGEMMVLAASAIFTVQIMALEEPRWSGCHGLQTTAAMFVVMSAISLPLVACTGPGLAAVPACVAVPGAVLPLAAIILLGTCLPYAIMNRWQREVSSTEAGIIYCSEALFAAGASLALPSLLARLLGVPYADEVPTATMAVGGGLVVAGAVLVQLRRRF